MGGFSFLSAMLRLAPSSLDVRPDLSWMTEFKEGIDANLPWILLTLGAGAVLYSIYLGVNIARADKEEKAQEAKKRIVNFFIGVASGVALIGLMYLLFDQIPKIWGVSYTNY